MNAIGLTHLAFRVDTIDELNEIARRAGGRAWPDTLSTVSGLGIGGGTVQNVYLTDPDGIRIECMTGTPDFAASETGPSQLKVICRGTDRRAKTKLTHDTSAHDGRNADYSLHVRPLARAAASATNLGLPPVAESARLARELLLLVEGATIVTGIDGPGVSGAGEVATTVGTGTTAADGGTPRVCTDGLRVAVARPAVLEWMCHHPHGTAEGVRDGGTAISGQGVYDVHTTCSCPTRATYAAAGGIDTEAGGS